jgi:type II secretion system protein H
MVCPEEYPVLSQFQSFKCRKSSAPRQRGFTMLELMVVLFIVGVMTAMAIPQVEAALDTYRLNSAVSSVTWAIQTTRYQAIMHGYPYQVAINAANNTYQVSSTTGGASFANLGTAVPIANQLVTISTDTTFQFSPNGSVSAALGNMNFTVSSEGATKTVTVSNYGSITVQ